MWKLLRYFIASLYLGPGACCRGQWGEGVARAAAGARGCRGRGGGGGAAAEAGGRGPGGAPPAGRCWGPQSSGANISCKPEVSTKFRESFCNIRKCMSTKLDNIIKSLTGDLVIAKILWEFCQKWTCFTDCHTILILLTLLSPLNWILTDLLTSAPDIVLNGAALQRSLDLRDAAAGGLLGLPAAGGGGRVAPPGHRGRGGHRGWPDGGHGAGAAHSPLQSTHKSHLLSSPILTFPTQR